MFHLFPFAQTTSGQNYFSSLLLYLCGTESAGNRSNEVTSRQQCYVVYGRFLSFNIITSCNNLNLEILPIIVITLDNP